MTIRPKERNRSDRFLRQESLNIIKSYKILVSNKKICFNVTNYLFKSERENIFVLPATHAVMKQANDPATNARNATAAKSFLRDGHMALRAPI